MKENQIKVLDYNQRESFFPLPVGEFRWQFKHLSDPSVYVTAVRRTTRDALANIKPIKNTLKRCFVLLKSKGGH